MSQEVVLAMYDITGGMAKQLSMAFIGKQVDAVYHTSIIAFGTQYYFGGGICKDKPETTPFGKPIEKRKLGQTQLPKQVFQEFLEEVGHKYVPEKYNLVSHNCNNFTDEACEFLTGQGIPKFILNQGEQLLSTPMGQMFKPMLEQMQSGQVSQMNQMGGMNGMGGFGGGGMGGYGGGMGGMGGYQGGQGGQGGFK